MSHFSNIKTKIRDLTALKTSLTNLGIDWKEGPVRSEAIKDKP